MGARSASDPTLRLSTSPVQAPVAGRYVFVMVQGGRIFTEARSEVVRIGDYDPDLFAELGSEREQAEQVAVAEKVELEPINGKSPLAPDDQTPMARLMHERDSLGLLILEGLLWRETSVGTDSGIELLGPGDLLRPWVKPVPESQILTEPNWTVLERTSIGILDRRFALVIARWPAVVATLMDRLILRSRWLSFHLAICHVRSLPERILLAMWHFADRWGRVGRDGVIVPVRLPHRMLAQLVGARRPSVTTSLASLRAEGLLVERADGSWLLPGGPPERLRSAYELASASQPIHESDRR
jgi:CRP/FNR family transcriptional regulator, cyclic AMP receptor protein